MNAHDATEIAYKRGYNQAVRDIFEDIEEEIEAALESNYKVREEREREYYDFDDIFLSCICGKIAALSGIDDFIEELKEKYLEADDEQAD
jgi:hypothetical protein